MEINESLKRFRREHDLTQDAVAKTLGTTKQVYYRYEKDVIPSSEIIKKIAVAFGVSADYLLGITDNPAVNTSSEVSEQIAALALQFTEQMNKLLPSA